MLPLHHGSIPLVIINENADPPGFEPGPTDPESAVLPLHHGSVAQRHCKIIKLRLITQKNYMKIFVKIFVGLKPLPVLE